MIHPKDGGQVGQTISHYKISDKLGEVRLVPQCGTDEIRPFVETSALALCESRASSNLIGIEEMIR